jgi:hypothetical protein
MTEPPKITVDWNVGDIKDKRLSRLYAYWSKLCGDRRMPARGDFDPIDVHELLPNVFLIDVLNDPLDFRFRLAGTHFRELAGVEVTGKLIGEVFPPEFCSEVRIHWAAAVEQRKPLWGSGRHWLADRDYVEWQGIVLPLSPDAEVVNMLLGGSVFALGGKEPKTRRVSGRP